MQGIFILQSSFWFRQVPKNYKRQNSCLFQRICNLLIYQCYFCYFPLIMSLRIAISIYNLLSRIWEEEYTVSWREDILAQQIIACSKYNIHHRKMIILNCRQIRVFLQKPFGWAIISDIVKTVSSIHSLC